MYVPKIHDETRPEVLHGLIRAHPLGTWVTAGAEGLAVDHVPFLLDPDRGEHGTLIGHVARANPVWKIAPALPAVVVFRGPQAYVSPSWYPSKHAHGKAVPTWNYAVVTVHGTPRFIDDRAWLLAQLARLTDAHEASRALPWQLSDAPADYVDKLLTLIVGVEIPVARIEGKWKTSQNRSEADRLGVAAGLLGEGGDEAEAMAALVRDGTG